MDDRTFKLLKFKTMGLQRKSMFDAHQNINYLQFITNELKDFGNEDDVSIESEDLDDDSPANKDSLGRRFRHILNIEFSVANTSSNVTGQNVSSDSSVTNADISMNSN